MGNPFEDPEGRYLVLANEEGQHSLWPSSIAVPEGWTIASNADSYQTSLEYVEQHWFDMRPASLARAMRDQ